MLGGAVIALVGTPSGRQSPPAALGTKVKGTKLRSEPAAPLLAHIESGGEPPSGVVGSLAVPAGAVYVRKAAADRGVGPFDRSVTMTVGAPEAEVDHFFRVVLSDERWVAQSITSSGPSSGEIIADRYASGYQWRVGVTLAGAHTTVAPALAGSGQSAAKTTVTIRIYEVDGAS